MVKFAIVLSAILQSTVMLTACGSDDGRSAENGSAGAAAAVESGADIYARACASCHGAAGEGAAAPGFAGVVERLPDVDEHTRIVVEGSGQMPGFATSLDATEIAAVVAYQREVLDRG